MNERCHQTWQKLFAGTKRCRDQQAHPLFLKGLIALGIDGERVPDLEEVNHRLMKLTGWRGVLVEGLEDARSFYSELARREFPIGDFIRDESDLTYTPEPDIFHDLYGHLPLLADREYAEFCYRFGRLTMKYADHPEALREFERVFWFGVEFPVIKTKVGRRIFGGGILSSAGESDYALSDSPKVLPFDVEVMRKTEFRIDQIQPVLFELDSPAQLYSCLGPLESAIAAEYTQAPAISESTVHPLPT